MAEISTPTTKLMFSGVIDKIKNWELPTETERSRCGRFVQFEGAEDPVPYWDDPRIHSLGNNNWISAVAAPFVTKLIDVAAYDGVDLRKQILMDSGITRKDSVVDLCCGIGTSTAAWGTGVDTSKSFLKMGKVKNILNPSMKFVEGNAETYGETNSVDVVTCMFATHEMP